MAVVPFTPPLGIGGTVAVLNGASRLYDMYNRAYEWLGPDGRQFLGDAVGNFTQSLGQGFQNRASIYARLKNNTALVRVPPRAAASVPAQRALGGALYAPMYSFRRYRRFRRRYRRRFGYRRYRPRRYSAFRYV